MSQTIALYFVCEMTICMLYAIAVGITVFDFKKAPPELRAQIQGRKILAYTFFCMGVFYFLHLFTASFVSHSILEDSYLVRILLLHIAVFPILLYVRFSILESRISFKKWSMFLVASFGGLLAALCIGEAVGMSAFRSVGLRGLGAAIWLAQASLYAYLFYWIRVRAGQLKYLDRHIKIVACMGGIVSVAGFPLWLLPLDTPYWLILQSGIWLTHALLFRYIFTKGRMIIPRRDLELRLPALLTEESAVYSVRAGALADDELYRRIVSYFETDKPYLKAGVNVADIAARLFTNKTYVSRLLNEKLDQNFNQFINTYRIREAQRLVAEEGPIPLPTLCKRVGFTSMASFTVAFKLNTGMTPGEWCRKQKHSP
ncbi:MAG: helix-turn-helix domain-containing protein [Bacteroidales bacterium]|nr:helix-turn-helix domain-containing protein [Bacteroidales bacterium]